MRRKIKSRYDRMNGSKLTLLAVAGIALLVGAFLGRTIQTTQADREICRKVDRLDTALIVIVKSGNRPLKPHEPGYAYYAAHPDENANRGTGLQPAIQQLRKAACDPANLPSSP